MAKVATIERQFTIALGEHEVCALFLALDEHRLLACTSPAYKLKADLTNALGYTPTEDIY